MLYNLIYHSKITKNEFKLISYLLFVYCIIKNVCHKFINRAKQLPLKIWIIKIKIIFVIWRIDWKWNFIYYRRRSTTNSQLLTQSFRFCLLLILEYSPSETALFIQPPKEADQCWMIYSELQRRSDKFNVFAEG